MLKNKIVSFLVPLLGFVSVLIFLLTSAVVKAECIPVITMQAPI